MPPMQTGLERQVSSETAGGMTKPRGMHATFATDCPNCEGELTVTNGSPGPHQCERPVSLADIRAALAAK